MTTLAEYAGSRELLGNLTQRELRGKYKRSALGWAWSLINPLALAAMFTFVFGVVFQSKLTAAGNSDLHGIAAFPLYLLCGLLPWNFVSNGINGSIGALVGNANLVKKVYFPREILIGANVLSWAVSLLIEMAVLGIALLAVGNMWLKFLPLVLITIVFLTLFVTGVGMLLAILNVYFRDVQHFVGIFLQLWFYATPIIYPITLLSGHDWSLGPVHLLTLFKLNPMTDFVEVFHQMLFRLTWPDWTEFSYAIVSSVVVFAFGLFVFKKLEPRLAEEL
ncbi:MAG: transporter [Frankiales bacterium]|jgi:ABC-type polysaccharide/polyol phosphate export permease|nr:transporter [Frankiales bacterium]